MMFIVFYSYAGYGILAIMAARIPFLLKLVPKPYNSRPGGRYTAELPRISLIISVSGETSGTMLDKIINTEKLNYPKDKLEVIYAAAFEKPDDSAVSSYYNCYIEDLNNGTNEYDEQLYCEFLKFEGSSRISSGYILDEIEKKLNNAGINSGMLTLNSKLKLDRFYAEIAENERIEVKFTKDIIRKGKISQVNRTIKNATGEIVVFSDVNTEFNRDSLMNLAAHFCDPSVGCVAGEKRISAGKNSTSDEGEGLYWKYESRIKEADSAIYSTVGAAGEIFAIRKELWEKVYTPGAIIEDFVISMKIAALGYTVKYEKNAYAIEEPTGKINDEYIRRRRIAAGGFQAIVMLKSLLNIFKYRILSFQYISHRVLRWAVVPFILPLLLVLNIYLASGGSYLYTALLFLQVSYYLLSAGGYILELKKKKIKLLYFPYFITMMNTAAYSGLVRYISGKQSVVWEKVKRA